MSIFDKEDDFALVARRMKEIKAAEEAWFATPPKREPFVHTPPDKAVTTMSPDLEQEWWDEYYNGGG